MKKLLMLLIIITVVGCSVEKNEKKTMNIESKGDNKITGFVIVDSTKINYEGEEKLAHPKFSESGRFLFCTTDNYRGIILYDFSKESFRTLSDELYSGYSFIISPDEKSIFYITRSEQNAILSYSIEEGKTIHLYTSNGKISNLALTTINNIIFSENGITKCIDNTGQLVDDNFGDYQRYSVDGNSLVIDKSGNIDKINPFNKNLIIRDVDPKGNRVIISTGDSTYLFDPVYKRVKKLGKYSGMQFSGVEGFYLAEEIKDDGMQEISSEIFLISEDGNFRMSLSDKTTISSAPTINKNKFWVAYLNRGNSIVVMKMEKSY